MSWPDHRSLLFRPAQCVQAKRRPMIFRFAAGINFFLQTQEAKMPRLMRSESGNFHIVPEQIRILRYLINLSREKLLLIVEARTPREIGPDLEVLAQAMANHVRRMNAFARIC